jgi:pimeloyl-ACP methyl ester carboxylesterase
MSELFPGFTTRHVATAGARIHCEVGGSGPPLLLLHGYPQTHAMWHRIAPRLAERYTVVCSDLRGYGDSSKPDGGEGHVAYSKREMAKDQVEADASARLRAIQARRPRSRRARRASVVPRSSAGGRARRGARHLANPVDVRQQRHGLRDRVLPLVLPDPAVRLARAAHRFRSRLLPAQEARRVVVGTWSVRPSRARRIRAVLCRPGDDPRDLRGLPCSGVDRPRARWRGCACPRAVPAVGAMGREGSGSSLFRSDCGLEERRPRRARQALASGHYLAEEVPEETLAELQAFFEG